MHAASRESARREETGGGEGCRGSMGVTSHAMSLPRYARKGVCRKKLHVRLRGASFWFFSSLSTCKEVLSSSADGSARNALPCFCFVSSIQLREQDTADHLPCSRMRNLQGQAVKGRELAEIVWQALEAVEGEL
jgi:hypothetical protein